MIISCCFAPFSRQQGAVREKQPEIIDFAKKCASKVVGRTKQISIFNFQIRLYAMRMNNKNWYQHNHNKLHTVKTLYLRVTLFSLSFIFRGLYFRGFCPSNSPRENKWFYSSVYQIQKRVIRTLILLLLEI